jgi:hypothetical protein
LAKLHIFCIDDKQEPEGIPETTINDPDSYTTMDDANEIGISVPKEVDGLRPP